MQEESWLQKHETLGAIRAPRAACPWNTAAVPSFSTTPARGQTEHMCPVENPTEIVKALWRLMLGAGSSGPRSSSCSRFGR